MKNYLALLQFPNGNVCHVYFWCEDLLSFSLVMRNLYDANRIHVLRYVVTNE